MKKNLILVLVAAGLLTAVSVSAHQSRLAYRMTAAKDAPIVITNADVSQAFYGQLKGEIDYYDLQLASPLDFYFQILVPDIADIRTSLIAQLNDSNGKPLAVLNGLGYPWQKFHEDFAGDDYLQGPEKKISLPAGDYRLMVSSPNNLGKYVLVVGEKESFPLGESLKTLRLLPGLKKFFNKPLWAIYEGRIGSGLLVATLIVLAVILLIVGFVLFERRKKK
ncbi:MAG: hypothetical protein WC668_02445 [Patescibacteria group bacterium]|jgi:hypothetical protein